MPELNEEILHLYLDKKLSYRQVAKHMGLSNSTVAKRIKNLGIGRTRVESTKLRSSPEYSESIRQMKIGEKNTLSNRKIKRKCAYVFLIHISLNIEKNTLSTIKE